MKAQPIIFDNQAYVQVEPERATHVKIRLPGPSGVLFIPVMIKGTREGTGRWTWNGDIEKPTLRPSVLTQCGHFDPHFKAGDSCWCTYNKEHPNEPSPFYCFRCHTWINDGKAQFLPDCSHELVGKTLDLLDADSC
jgi:hypothetical protein